MLKIDGSVKALYLQFSFSNENAVPKWLPWKEEETPAESKERRERKTHGTGQGICVIQPTEGCSLESLPAEIASTNFTLADAYAQPRMDPNNPRKRWYMARFVFLRKEDMTRDELGGELRENVELDLEELCILAFWRVRAFKNPYFKDQEPVPGLSAASVNLVARKPRFRPDGELILEWERDAAGNKVGNAPHSIPPTAYLRVQDSVLQLTDNEPAE